MIRRKKINGKARQGEKLFLFQMFSFLSYSFNHRHILKYVDSKNREQPVNVLKF